MEKVSLNILLYSTPAAKVIFQSDSHAKYNKVEGVKMTGPQNLINLLSAQCILQLSKYSSSLTEQLKKPFWCICSGRYNKVEFEKGKEFSNISYLIAATDKKL